MRNKEEVVENLALEDCPIYQTTNEYHIRTMPLNPLLVLMEVPNYLVENRETGKIDFANDSLSLCRHFIELYSEGSKSGKKEYEDLATMLPDTGTTLN